jgi:metallo-beta-lactamase family protein
MESRREFTFGEAQLLFLGAAGEVTGSKCLLRTHGRKLLIDCGLFQGEKTSREKNWAPIAEELSGLDAVILTHAHLDHSGYLPRLVRSGYRGPVYCSGGTRDLLSVMLYDSAHLQEEDAEYANRSGYSHHRPAEPLYTVRDVQQTLPLLQTLAPGLWHTIVPGVEAELARAGHIVGSSTLRFRIKAHGSEQFLTFSGDVGHDRQKTIRGPDPLRPTDVLVLESTYGDREHAREDALDRLEEVLHRAHRQRGTVVIPSFAVGRAQELLFLIRILEDQGRITPVPVILDSPMSSEATQIYLEHPEDHPPHLSFEKKTRNFFPERFELIRSGVESAEIASRKGPLVIVSASGMLQGGRVLHHLKTRLPDPKNIVLFVGYQAEGTKGWFLKNHGKKEGALRIHHQPVPVRASIEAIESLSAHGDARDLIDWIRTSPKPPRDIVLNHGSPGARDALARRIQAELGIKAGQAG